MSDHVKQRNRSANVTADGTSTRVDGTQVQPTPSTSAPVASQQQQRASQPRYGSWIGYQIRKALDSLTPEEQGATVVMHSGAAVSEETALAHEVEGIQAAFASAGSALLTPSAAPPLDAKKYGNWLRLLAALHAASYWVMLAFTAFALWHSSRSLHAYLGGMWDECVGMWYISYQIVVAARTCIVHFGELLLLLVLVQAHCSLDYVLVEANQEVHRNSTTNSQKED